MKSKTDVNESTTAPAPVEGIYTDLFKDAKRVDTNPIGLRDASLGDCGDWPNDCDCECAPQCPDCDCN